MRRPSLNLSDDKAPYLWNIKLYHGPGGVRRGSAGQRTLADIFVKIMVRLVSLECAASPM